MFVVTGETRARCIKTRSAREVLPIGRARREPVPRCDAGRTLGQVCGAWKREERETCLYKLRIWIVDGAQVLYLWLIKRV